MLDRVDMCAERGQFVGLIGPNGAGKSTLLRAISNVLDHQEGSVSLHGEDLSSLSARRVAELLALVPQIAPYTQGFTAFELVLMGRYPHLGRFQVEGATDDRIARDAMRLTQTEEFSRRTMRLCRAASASECSSPVPWLSSPRCCYWTSRPQILMSCINSRS